jgi:hypothetical protein
MIDGLVDTLGNKKIFYAICFYCGNKEGQQDGAYQVNPVQLKEGLFMQQQYVEPVK